MLQAFELSYEPHPLVGTIFTNVHLAVRRGERVALVGRNGCGKTKLLEILTGRLVPTTGRVVRTDGDVLGYLPQDFDFSSNGTLEEFLWTRSAEMAVPEQDLELGLRKLGPRLGLNGLESREYQALSLGERMRAAILLLLCQSPDVLLLDEPTNHLDLEARLWLEQFLKTCSQGVLMVCHDRAIMDSVVGRVLELGEGGITEYTGNYSDMLAAKSQRHAREKEEWERQKMEDRRLRIVAEKTLQRAAEMTKRPTGRTYDPKAKAFYAGKQASLDKRAKAIKSRVAHLRQHALDKPFEPDQVHLQFSAKRLRCEICLAVRGLEMEFSAPLFSGINFTLERDSRLALVGANGCGKTTVFRLLTGELAPSGGSVQFAPGVEVAYLSQSRGALDPTKPLMEALETAEPERARTLLGQLAMRGDIVFKRVGDLSVGERTKLEIVKLLLSPANMLLLDEPTNHLDVESLEALESALAEFPGPIVFASHDRQFVEKVATEVLDLTGR